MTVQILADLAFVAVVIRLLFAAARLSLTRGAGQPTGLAATRSDGVGTPASDGSRGQSR